VSEFLVLMGKLRGIDNEITQCRFILDQQNIHIIDIEKRLKALEEKE